MHITTTTTTTTLWLLAALSRLAAAARGSMPTSDDADAAPTSSPDETSQTTITTITTTFTRTVTLEQNTVISAAPDEMTVGATEYELQGCFGGQDGVGAVLGTDFIIPAAPGATSDMSSSLCLKLCADAVGRMNETYSYVGVSGGESCYCGTTLNSTASQASANNCTLPCAGNNTEICGGTDFISVYKLISPTGGAVPAPHSKFAGDATISKNETNADKRHPGVPVGIALGSAAGLGLVAFLLFLAARYYSRRKQRLQAQERGTTIATTEVDSAGYIGRRTSSTTDTTTTSADQSQGGPDLREHPVVREATRVDLRRLDGVVMDSHLPSPRTTTARASAIGLASTTTGAEWRGGQGSPLTPRTPRRVDVEGGEEQGESTTPSILVHPPNNVAPSHGLGERAWHRRRLSMPFPPHGAAARENGAGDGNGLGEVGDRRVLLSQGSAETTSLRFEADGEDAVSALSESGTASSPSWRWTVSTMSTGERTKGDVSGFETPGGKD